MSKLTLKGYIVVKVGKLVNETAILDLKKTYLQLFGELYNKITFDFST